MISVRNIIILLLTAFLLSCTSHPEGVLSRGKMEDALYDYHLAQAMVSRDQEHSDSIWASYYDKHDMTVEMLDSSLRYYAGRAKVMEEIYKGLDERFKKDKEMMGLNVVHKATSMLSFSESGDTIEVWPDVRFLYLNNSTYSSIKRFEIPGDSSFYVHDRFELRFSAHFLKSNPEGRDLLVAAMIVNYDNDSISTSIRSISSDQMVSLDIRADSVRRIRNVQGFVTIGSRQSNPLIIEGICMYKYHTDSSFPYGKEKDEEKSKQDETVAEMEDNGEKIVESPSTVVTATSPSVNSPVKKVSGATDETVEIAIKEETVAVDKSFKKRRKTK